MRKKVIKKEPKYLTMPVFEKHQDFMAKSFAKVFEKLDQHEKQFIQMGKVMESMLGEIKNFKEETRDHRMMISGLNHTDINQERKIIGLETRLEKLEQKVK